jgi:nucleotide-binding universal stress UspA family protein
MYEHILVPTDGSDAATSAVDHAVDLAEQYDATLHVLYVIDANAYSTLEAGSDVVINALEEEGETAVQAVADRASEAGVDVVTEVVTGTVHHSIIDYAGEEGMDLIVMGTHGRRGLDRYLLGSVTEKVVRTAEVPVLTVRVDDEDDD